MRANPIILTMDAKQLSSILINHKLFSSEDIKLAAKRIIKLNREIMYRWECDKFERENRSNLGY